MLTSPARHTAQPRGIEFQLTHYLTGQDSVSWHAQLELTRLDDPTFGSALLSKDTSSSQSNWYYRDEQATADNGNWQAWPAGGVPTKYSEAQDLAPSHDRNAEVPLVAAALYQLTTADLASLPSGPIRARARQSGDGGSNWGEWYAWTIP